MGLTQGQEEALIEAKLGNNVFITGGGGVGKSYIVNCIVAALENRGKTVMVTASTGKAASLIGGVTCHSAVHIPIKAAWLAEPIIRKDDPIYETDVILIDEVSMLRIDAFEFVVKTVEAVNKLRRSVEYLNDTENKHRNPIQMIVVGDFCQLPPVIIHPQDGSPDEGEMMSEYYGFDIGRGYAFQAPGWKRSNFITCELTEVMRQSDKPMIDALNGIRFNDRSMLPYFKENMRKQKYSANEKGVVYLCGKNKTADRINNTEISKIQGREITYHAKCIGQVSDQDKQAPDHIRLKVGAQVIMAQNTDKYHNGSSATVTDLYSDGISVLIHETGEEIKVTYAIWDIERYTIVEKDKKKKLEKEVVGSFSQLPLKLGYAITIHKSQGQTFDKVVLVLGSDDKKKDAKSTHPEIFASGQLYVGLSRVRSMDGLYIEGNLDLVKTLTANEVMQFYGVERGAVAEQEVEEQAQKLEEVQESVDKHEKKKKKIKQEYSKKKIKKEDVNAKEKENESYALIHCTEKTIVIAWVFAQELSPDAKISGMDIYIPNKFKKQAEDFLYALNNKN